MAERMSVSLKVAAQQLAADVTVGPCSELGEATRFELRQLSLALASWADRVETLEMERMDRRFVEVWIERLSKPRVLLLASWSLGCDLAAVVALLLVLAR